MKDVPHRFEELTLADTVEHILVVSDLHAFRGPLEAFDGLRTSFRCSQVIFNGDIFPGGTEPVETLEWVRGNAAEFAVLGNHDERVLGEEGDDGTIFTEAGIARRLPSEQRAYLAALPHTLDVLWRGRRIRVTHGHRLPSGELGPPDSFRTKPRGLVARYEDSGADLVCVAHTHYAFVYEATECIVANGGSMSWPILAVEEEDGTVVSQGDDDDPAGDTRSSFLAVSENGGTLTVEITRFDYDRGKALERLRNAGHPHLPHWEALLGQGLLPRKAV